MTTEIHTANLEALLRARLAPAFSDQAGEPADPVLRRSQRADFQADGALGLARKLGISPRTVAQQVVAAAPLEDLCSSVEVAGPGFINLTVRDDVLGQMLASIIPDDRLGVPLSTTPEKVVVDYSAPNVAKEMHVGHLRSTVIGDAAVRVLEWLGHQVVKANHVGDWGTPFGMLIEHMLDIGEAEATHELSVGDLDAFYKAARKSFDSEPDFAARARLRVVALQRGDPTTRAAWQLLVQLSEKYFLSVYDRLDLRLGPDDFAGESSYNDQLQPVVNDLERLGLLRESEGARCVFPHGFTNREGEPLPIIVRKSDGGFGYGATDLAALRYRTHVLGATRLLYVVGLPQRQHLEWCSRRLGKRAGWTDRRTRSTSASVRCLALTARFCGRARAEQ